MTAEASITHRLQPRLDRHLMRRSAFGIPMYPLACLALGMAATGGWSRPQTFYALCAATVVIAAARGYLVLRFDDLYKRAPRRWRLRFRGLMLAAVTAWGAICALAIIEFQLSDPAFVALLASAVMGSNAIVNYVADPLLVRAYVVIASLMPIAGLLTVDATAAVWIAAAYLVYTAYLLIQGRRLHEDYLQAQVNAELLAQRAAELEEARYERELYYQRHLEHIREAKEAAEQADRAKGDFLAHMSHEIRNPMGGILGIASLLLKSDLAAREREYVELIHSSAEGLLGVVGDVLDLSKIEAGKLEIDREPFALREIVAGVTELFEPQLRAKGVELRCEIDPAVPAPLIGDGARLRQILINLMSNAAKFTPRGRITLWVEASGEARDSEVEVRFSLHDTGIGVPEAAREHLFKPYSQVAGRDRQVGGTGLGLMICQQLVELMGGRIALDSTTDVGTTVQFSVVFGTLEPAAPRVRDEGPPPVVPPLRDGFEILLAEDNDLNQLITLEQLRSLGYRVEAVSNGLEVLEALSRTPYDLILMDCQMPELDGYETTRKIRGWCRERSNVPIVALTACAMSGDREKCLAAGMDDYVAKPFREDDIVDVLERWLGKPGAQVGAGELH